MITGPFNATVYSCAPDPLNMHCCVRTLFTPFDWHMSSAVVIFGVNKLWLFLVLKSCGYLFGVKKVVVVIFGVKKLLWLFIWC